MWFFLTNCMLFSMLLVVLFCWTGEMFISQRATNIWTLWTNCSGGIKKYKMFLNVFYSCQCSQLKDLDQIWFKSILDVAVNCGNCFRNVRTNPCEMHFSSYCQMVKFFTFLQHVYIQFCSLENINNMKSLKIKQNNKMMNENIKNKKESVRVTKYTQISSCVKWFTFASSKLYLPFMK